MKKLLALVLLLSVCLTACAPDVEVMYFTPTPDPESTEKAYVPSPTPSPTPSATPEESMETAESTESEDIVLRMLVNERDLTEYQITVFEETALYREHQNMPEIPLEYTEIKHPGDIYEPENLIASFANYYDTIALKLLAGDDDFDMFYISHTSYFYARAQVNAMLNPRYFTSMESLGLAELYDGMLPGVKELCMAEGETLLAPIGFQFTAHRVKQEPLRRLGVSLDDIPGTAVAFTDFLLGLRDKMEAEQIIFSKDWGIRYFINSYEEQYSNEYMSHGTNTQPMWDALVYAIDTLCTSGLLESESGVENNVPYDFPAIYYTDALLNWSASLLNGGSSSDSLYETEDTAPIPYIRLTDDAKEPLSSGMFLAVNPNSKIWMPWWNTFRPS